MNLIVTSLTLVEGHTGPDVLLLDTALPSAVWPYKGTQTIKMSLAKGTGRRYAREHFPGVALNIVESIQEV